MDSFPFSRTASKKKNYSTGLNFIEAMLHYSELLSCCRSTTMLKQKMNVEGRKCVKLLLKKAAQG